MISNLELNAISFEYSKDFHKNLKKLEALLKKTKPNSLSLAPELCLSGYSYEDMTKAANFSKLAIEKLKIYTKDKALGLSLITKENDNFYNKFIFFDNGKITHTQDKVKLFPLGNEQSFFKAGNINQIKSFNFKGLKIGVLICFELRFTNLWQKLNDCDLILIPAFWAKTRKKHFEILLQALGISNQCFILSANSKNKDMANSSAIITPLGESIKDDRKNLISFIANLKEIKIAKKYIKMDTNG